MATDPEQALTETLKQVQADIAEMKDMIATLKSGLTALDGSRSGMIVPVPPDAGDPARAGERVAQLGLIALEDATNVLRSISSTAAVSAGSAIASALAGKPNPQALQEIQQMMTSAIADYSAISGAVVAMINEFPATGDQPGEAK